MTSGSQPADADVASPFAVLTAVGRLATASEQASLVRLGLSSGLLARYAEWVRPSDLAAAVGAPETAVTAVCTALVALGALRREGTGVRLSAAWMPLARDGLDVRLEAALENAFARLRPGGLLLCPVLPGEDESPEAGSPGAQQASLNSIIISRWGIPVLPCDDLAKEIAAAGFSGPRAHRGNLMTSVTARRA